MKTLATATYDFEGLITGGYVYVDKTDMLYRLAKRDKDAIYFISRPRRFGKTLFSLYAALPSTWRVKDEAEAKRYFQLFMKMAGARIQAEEMSARGNADVIVETKKAVYVFEFKFNRSAKAAIRQIREKGYADAYKADKRPVTLIGINFSARKRNIDEPVIEGVTT